MSDSMAAALTQVRTTPGLAAALRRGVFRPIGEVPEVWSLLAHWGQDLDDSRAEAIFRALCLYAIHIQSVAAGVDCHKPGTPASSDSPARPGPNLGDAIARLARHSGGALEARRMSEDAINRRLARAMGARNQAELVQTLSSLVRLMKDQHHPVQLDYNQLARDIYSWGYLDGRAQVQKHWGLAFARASQPSTNNPDQENTDNAA